MDRLVKELEEAAHHEAGHALMAHIVGWSIQHIDLRFNGHLDDRGVTRYDFGGEDPETPDNAVRLVYQVLGGPVAQTIFENKTVVDLFRPEFVKDREKIEHIFGRFPVSKQAELINAAILEVYQSLSEPNSRAARLAIVNELLSTRHLTKQEFVKIVKELRVEIDLIKAGRPTIFMKVKLILKTFSVKWKKKLRVFFFQH